jgi:hypothetical protein
MMAVLDQTNKNEKNPKYSSWIFLIIIFFNLTFAQNAVTKEILGQQIETNGMENTLQLWKCGHFENL